MNRLPDAPTNSPNLTATASIWLLVGLFFAGAGQIAYVFVPLAVMETGAVAVLTSWQAISIGVGLAIATPANNVVFAQLSETSERWTSAARAQSSFFIRYGSLAIIVVSAPLALVLEGSLAARLAYWVILASSLVLQLLAAIQRAQLSSAGEWRRLAIHFAADGILRSGFAIALTNLNFGVVSVMISGVLSTGLTLVICEPLTSFAKYFGSSPKMLSRNRHRFMSALGASSAIQVLVSAPPYAANLVGKEPDIVKQFSALSQVQRLAITLLVPVVVPLINQIAMAMRNGELRTAQGKSLRGSLAVLSVGLLISAGVQGPAWLLGERITYVHKIFGDLHFEDVIGGAMLLILLPMSIFWQQITLLGTPGLAQRLVWPLVVLVNAIYWLLPDPDVASYYLTASASILFAIGYLAPRRKNLVARKVSGVERLEVG